MGYAMREIARVWVEASLWEQNLMPTEIGIHKGVFLRFYSLEFDSLTHARFSPPSSEPCSPVLVNLKGIVPFCGWRTLGHRGSNVASASPTLCTIQD